MLAACLFSGAAAANVVIATTRVIYPAEQTEVTVSLSNKGPHPSLVQVWIDDDRPDVPVETLDVPFSMTPALFRLDPDKGQTLRLFQHAHDFPSDRESLFWLNVLDIPPAGANGNALQLSVRSRIKLFYRPRDLPGTAQHAVSALTWNMVKRADAWVLEARNPSRYY
ncbi:MAG: fimbrial biogenesis chaperone, partial [Pseudomonas sp.]